jgi:hypothetical protein
MSGRERRQVQRAVRLRDHEFEAWAASVNMRARLSMLLKVHPERDEFRYDNMGMPHAANPITEMRLRVKQQMPTATPKGFSHKTRAAKPRRDPCRPGRELVDLEFIRFLMEKGQHQQAAEELGHYQRRRIAERLQARLLEMKTEKLQKLRALTKNL